jgi:peptidylprolyl isomerase
MRFPRLAVWLGAPLLAGCASHRAAPIASAIPAIVGKPREAFALRVIDVTPGTGAEAAARKCIYAHYTGWLTNGTKFDSSRDTMPNGKPKSPIAFAQGARGVIAGWDVGFEGMKVGASRRLLIPYQLGYGALGRPPAIPPKSELIFDVQLMAVADTLPRTEPIVRGQPAAPPRCPTWAAVSGAP